MLAESLDSDVDAVEAGGRSIQRQGGHKKRRVASSSIAALVQLLRKQFNSIHTVVESSQCHRSQTRWWISRHFIVSPADASSCVVHN